MSRFMHKIGSVMSDIVQKVHHSVSNEISLPFRVCHYLQLFVKSDGYVFPCCDVWGRDDVKIGHIADVDIIDKIRYFDKPCHCHKYQLRKAHDKDQQKCIQLNVELSLACQANCVMCCVDAPEWKGTYNYYADLERLVDSVRPEELFVQGGEVLVQKKSVAWLQTLREKYPDMRLAIATNGNVGEPALSEFEGLFDRYSISFVGFQPETYRKIMGIDIDRTLRFVDTILAWDNSLIQLKFLITPVNVHETGLFLNWALSKSPDRILISDAATEQYINMATTDNYWRKIIDLTSNDIKQALLSAKDAILANNTIIAFDLKARDMFSIDEAYAECVGLGRKIVTHSGWFPALGKIHRKK